MGVVPNYQPSQFVYRERAQPTNQTEADFDPRIINSWTAAKFRQLIFTTVIPFITFVLFAYYYTFGDITWRGINLYSAAVTTSTLNFLIIPFTFLNLRCPRCGLYVGSRSHPKLKPKIHHLLPSLSISQCPHCLARLK